MGPTLVIVSSIVIATIIVLMSEKFIHRSVTDFHPPSSPRNRSPFRNRQKDRKSDRFFLDEDWSDDDLLFDEPRLNKKRSYGKGSNESNRIIATMVFMAALVGLLLFLSQ